MPRWSPLCSLLVAAPVLAAPPVLDLKSVPTGEHPASVTSVKKCDEARPRLRTRRITVGKVVAESLHECFVSDGTSSLVIGIDGVWFVATGPTTSYVGANMTDAPLHIRLRSDALTRGTLADGSLALVQRIDLDYENMCLRAGCADAAKWQQQFVLVCPLASVTTNEPSLACGATSHRCPASGCRAVTLKKGVLAVTTKAGATSYLVHNE